MSAQPPASATPTESQWVDAELVRTLMQAAYQSQFAPWLLIPIFLALMSHPGAGTGLVAWGAAAVGVGALRAWMLLHFDRRLRAAEPVRQVAYYQRTAWLWPLTAGVWGITPLLFFERIALANQFGAWLILAVMVMGAANHLASHLRTARLYIHVMMGAALGSVVWRLGLELGLDTPLVDYWLVLFLLLFWLVLLQSARRQHLTHRRNFELQYRNTQLINSLTRQTQAAIHAVETKNRFLASATHDIRQPVHALQLYADWLANEPGLVAEIAPKIVESTKAVNTLFDSLFDLVRLDSGHVRLKVEEVPLDGLLADIELQYQPLAQAKGLSLRVRRAGPLAGAAVRSDPLLLRRVAGNLVSNAIKYTEKGGVLVAVRPGASGPVLEVWDTGVGIAPSHHREIFQEFFKVPIHSGTEDGFGLGLYIVSRLCYLLGHPVELASRPGRGSVFRLVMAPTDPVQAAARAADVRRPG